MFASLAPILPDNAGSSAETQAILARVEGLAPVLETVARIAGGTPQPVADPLAQSADLAADLATLPPATARIVAHDLDTLAIVLQAGLLALDRARAEGRLSRAAARLLQAEAGEQYRKALAAIRHAPHA